MLRGAIRILAVLLVVMYQVRGGTAPTFEALQKEAKESLEFHVEGLLENGEDVPEWLKNGDYEFVYNYLDATTLLKAY